MGGTKNELKFLSGNPQAVEIDDHMILLIYGTFPRNVGNYLADQVRCEAICILLFMLYV